MTDRAAPSSGGPTATTSRPVAAAKAALHALAAAALDSDVDFDPITVSVAAVGEVELLFELRLPLGLTTNFSSLEVLEVHRSGQAEKLGVLPYWTIASVNGTQCLSLADFEMAVSQARQGAASSVEQSHFSIGFFKTSNFTSSNKSDAQSSKRSAAALGASLVGPRIPLKSEVSSFTFEGDSSSTNLDSDDYDSEDGNEDGRISSVNDNAEFELCAVCSFGLSSNEIHSTGPHGDRVHEECAELAFAAAANKNTSEIVNDNSSSSMSLDSNHSMTMKPVLAELERIAAAYWYSTSFTSAADTAVGGGAAGTQSVGSQDRRFGSKSALNNFFSGSGSSASNAALSAEILERSQGLSKRGRRDVRVALAGGDLGLASTLLLGPVVSGAAIVADRAATTGENRRSPTFTSASNEPGGEMNGGANASKDAIACLVCLEPATLRGESLCWSPGGFVSCLNGHTLHAPCAADLVLGGGSCPACRDPLFFTQVDPAVAAETAALTVATDGNSSNHSSSSSSNGQDPREALPQSSSAAAAAAAPVNDEGATLCLGANGKFYCGRAGVVRPPTKIALAAIAEEDKKAAAAAALQPFEVGDRVVLSPKLCVCAAQDHRSNCQCFGAWAGPLSDGGPSGEVEQIGTPSSRVLVRVRGFLSSTSFWYRADALALETHAASMHHHHRSELAWLPCGPDRGRPCKSCRRWRAETTATATPNSARSNSSTRVDRKASVVAEHLESLLPQLRAELEATQSARVTVQGHLHILRQHRNKIRPGAAGTSEVRYLEEAVALEFAHQGAWVEYCGDSAKAPCTHGAYAPGRVRAPHWSCCGSTLDAQNFSSTSTASASASASIPSPSNNVAPSAAPRAESSTRRAPLAACPAVATPLNEAINAATALAPTPLPPTSAAATTTRNVPSPVGQNESTLSPPPRRKWSKRSAAVLAKMDEVVKPADSARGRQLLALLNDSESSSASSGTAAVLTRVATREAMLRELEMGNLEMVARAVRQRNADAQWDVAWWSSSICSFDIRATNSHQGEEAEDMHEERSPPWRWQMYSYGNGNSSIVGPCIALLAQPRRGARQTTYRLMPGQSFEAIREVLDKHGNLWLKLGSTSLPPAIESSESNSSYGANRDLPLQGWLLVRPGGPGAPPVCRPLSGPGSSVPLCTACCEPLILQDHSANTSNNNLGSTNGSISCTGRFSRVTATGVRAGDQLFLFSSLEPVTVLRTTREGWIACKFGPHNQEDRGDGDDAAIDAGNDDGDDEDGGSVLYHCDALFKLATAPSSSLLGAPPRGSELVFKEDDTRWVLDAWHTRRELWLRCSRDTKRARNAWAAAAAAPQPSSSSSAPLTSSRSSNESNGEASTIGHHFASCLSGHLLHSRCFQAALVAGNNCPVCSASYFSPIVERTASDNHEKAAAGATSLSNHTDHTMRGAEEQSPNSANGVNAQEEDEEAPVVVAARAESVQVSGHELKMCPSCYAGPLLYETWSNLRETHGECPSCSITIPNSHARIVAAMAHLKTGRSPGDVLPTCPNTTSCNGAKVLFDGCVKCGYLYCGEDGQGGDWNQLPVWDSLAPSALVLSQQARSRMKILAAEVHCEAALLKRDQCALVEEYWYFSTAPTESEDESTDVLEAEVPALNTSAVAFTSAIAGPAFNDISSSIETPVPVAADDFEDFEVIFHEQRLGIALSEDSSDPVHGYPIVISTEGMSESRPVAAGDRVIAVGGVPVPTGPLVNTLHAGEARAAGQREHPAKKQGTTIGPYREALHCILASDRPLRIRFRRMQNTSHGSIPTAVALASYSEDFEVIFQEQRLGIALSEDSSDPVHGYPIVISTEGMSESRPVVAGDRVIAVGGVPVPTGPLVNTLHAGEARAAGQREHPAKKQGTTIGPYREALHSILASDRPLRIRFRRMQNP